jgi:hypothetical protein
LRSTVPVKGARITVFSLLAWASRSAASALRFRATAALYRASAAAARLVAVSRSCGDIRFALRARISLMRCASRVAWSRSDVASMTLASAAATFACACETEAW